ncbi:hypothetical protein FQA39_LY02595 [Lamprigera yunnana]|nr:hypothetical protein FQA39_LY02595 [Lamprigera yunnana]
MDISGLRKPYQDSSNAFLEKNIKVKDPIKLFHEWFQEAKNNKSIVEPNAMCLATATKCGIPSVRFVLCKSYGEDGFQFYTHYTSRKGQELEENPNVALAFYWDVLNRSVRIEGITKKLPMSFAEEYFKARPIGSRIGSLCSDQSKVVESRAKLVEASEKLQEKYKNGDVPKPELWGGYVVIPSSIEFWQGQTDRIHDRIKFRLLKEDEVPDNVLTHSGEEPQQSISGVGQNNELPIIGDYLLVEVYGVKASHTTRTLVLLKAILKKTGTLRIIDIPGHERLRGRFFEQYKSLARGLVYIVDSITLQKDVRDAAEFLYNILCECTSLKNTPVVIVSNKQDMPLAKTSTVIKSMLEKELNSLRITKSSQLESVDPKGQKLKVLGKEGVDFMFSHLPFPVEFVETSVSSKEKNTDALEMWLIKLTL